MRRVLLVEDDPGHAEALQRVLSLADPLCQVAVAGSLAAAEAALQQGRPDVILTDYFLPDGSATALLPDGSPAHGIPVIVMTSQGDETTAVEVIKAGAADYVVKSPGAFAELPKVLRGVVREWRFRRAAEEARGQLEERNALYRLLLESSGEAILLAIPGGRILAANPAACRMFGYPESVFCTLEEFVIAVDDPQRAHAHEVRAASGQFRGELVMRRGDGTVFEAEVVSNVFRDTQGEWRAASFVRDLTEQKRAERALRESERWLSHIVESLPEGAVLVKDGRLALNRAAEAIVGYGSEEIGTLDAWFELLFGETAASVRALYESDREGGLRHTREMALQRKDGMIRRVTFSGVCVDAGEIWVMRDVTDNRRAEQALRDSEQRFRTVTNAVPALIWMSSPDRRRVFVNDAWTDFTGLPAAKLLGTGWEAIVHEGDRGRLEEIRARVFAAREPYVLRYRLRRRDGEYRWIEDRGVPDFDESGRLEGFVGVAIDVTEAQTAEREMRIAAAAFETRDGMFVADSQGGLLRVNQAFLEATGVGQGAPVAALATAGHDAAFYASACRSAIEAGSWKGNVDVQHPDGSVFPAMLSLTPVRDASGKVFNLVGYLQDISEQRAAEEEIRRLAFFDPLTRLPNRRLLQDRLQMVAETSARARCQAALLFVDLDHFKVLNDSRGHSVGDALLVQVAQRLSRCVRRQDTVARLGGDEFVVLVSNLGDGEQEAAGFAESVADKILEALAEPFDIGGEPYEGGCSVGVVLFSGVGESVEDLLRRADVAMYRAKAAGRNTARFFDPAMQKAVEARAAMEAELRQAAARGQLRLAYQLQVDAAGVVLGAEALLRWNHPTRGEVSPAQFIPLAEETGAILSIGRWVLTSACEQLARWRTDPALSGLRLAVNVSARQFRQPSFVEDVLSILDRWGVDSARLKLEITESAMLEDVDQAIRHMEMLRQVGVGFSVDDFGTGYSSLSYLRRLPIEQLKIDRSFVHELVSDPDSALIVQAIIAMARHLRLDVIAEGVEVEEQFEFLRAHGCFAFQGYLFGRPVSVESFERLVRERAEACGSVPVEQPGA